MDTDTKQYLEVLFMGLQREITSFKDDLTRLSSEILKQGAAIHSIEINVTQKFTKLEGDINSAFDKIRTVSVDLDAEESVRVQSDMSFAKRLTDHENDDEEKWQGQKKRWENQIIENERNASTRNALKWIGGILGLQILLLLWQIFLNGGIANITP